MKSNKNQVWDQVTRKSYINIQKQVVMSVQDQVQDQVSNQITEQVRYQIWIQAWALIRNQDRRDNNEELQRPS